MTTPGRIDQARNSPRDVFPQPVDGDAVEIDPPAFCWLPVAGADEYRVLVEDAAGARVADETTSRNYLILRRGLGAGRYRWTLHVGERRRDWWDFSITDDAVEQIVPSSREVLDRIPAERPRHMFSRADVPAILAARGPQIEVLRRNVDLAVRDGLPARPDFHLVRDEAERRLAYREQFARHRLFIDRDLTACALGHLLLGDERAAEHSRASLLEISGWDPSGPCAVDGRWGDEIGLSHARCLFAAWDWTAELFDDAETRTIVSALVAYARQIERRLGELDFFAHPGHSHAGRLPAYLGSAAMVLAGRVERAESERWLQYALDVFGSFYPHFGGRDGGWAEGPFYASSYVKWPLPFLLDVERYAGASFLDRPFYRRVARFFLHFACPCWEVHPFGDGYWCRGDGDEWPGFLAQNPFSVYGERFGPEQARKLAVALVPRDHYELHVADAFVLPPPGAAEASGACEQTRAFRDAGFVSMHTCIEDPANDSAVLARASRYGSASHQHADQGSFAVVSQGMGLITPSGYFGPAYGTPHHQEWTRQTKAHNCILVDGRGQPAGSHLATGRIVAVRDEGRWAAATLDLSAAYAGLAVWRRVVMLIRPSLVIVYDDLGADCPRTFSWLAHCLSRPDLADDGQVTIRRPPASIELRLFCDAGPMGPPAWTDRFDPPVNAGVPERYAVEMPDQHHLRWDALPARARRFAAVMALNGGKAPCRFGGGVLEVPLPVVTGGHESQPSLRIVLDSSQASSLRVGEDDVPFDGLLP
jgi:hypothetical protein